MTPMIGQRYQLTRAMLGNERGTIGVAVHTYDLGEGPGVQVLFPNGQFDGFSPLEQSLFLVPVGICPEVADYQFANVIQLGRDFANGRFAPAFR